MKYWTRDFKRKQQRVNRALAKALPRPKSELEQAIQYSLLAPAKRFRPVLVLRTIEACGGKLMQGMPCACAVEMIHTYSLIHDDLPAMDNDDYRRGRLTCHRRYSESTAILAGDALATLAYDVMGKTPLAGATRAVFPYLVARLSLAIYQMICGQMMDLSAEGKKISLPRLSRLYAFKTGALIRCAVEFGALVSGLSPRSKAYAQLLQYASHLGLAFQIVDDILDETGDPKKMGKKPGQDRMHKKATYPAAVGLEKATRIAMREGVQAKQVLQGFPGEVAGLLHLVDFVLLREG